MFSDIIASLSSRFQDTDRRGGEERRISPSADWQDFSIASCLAKREAPQWKHDVYSSHDNPQDLPVYSREKPAPPPSPPRGSFSASVLSEPSVSRAPTRSHPPTTRRRATRSVHPSSSAVGGHKNHFGLFETKIVRQHPVTPSTIPSVRELHRERRLLLRSTFQDWAR